jgi:hypothetical protein
VQCILKKDHSNRTKIIQTGPRLILLHSNPQSSQQEGFQQCEHALAAQKKPHLCQLGSQPRQLHNHRAAAEQAMAIIIIQFPQSFPPAPSSLCNSKSQFFDTIAGTKVSCSLLAPNELCISWINRFRQHMMTDANLLPTQLDACGICSCHLTLKEQACHQDG